MRKAYVFLDVANIWSSQKSKGHLLDYSNLKKTIQNSLNEKLKSDVEVEKIFYYEAFPENNTREYNTDGTHKFMTYLKKGLGFEIRKKPIKQIRREEDGKIFIVEKGNMDIEIAIDALHHKEKYDLAVFFTGDSDFFPLIKYLMARKKESYIFSSDNNVSQELRTGANGYFNILKIEGFWGEKIKHRGDKK